MSLHFLCASSSDSLLGIGSGLKLKLEEFVSISLNFIFAVWLLVSPVTFLAISTTYKIEIETEKRSKTVPVFELLIFIKFYSKLHTVKSVLSEPGLSGHPPAIMRR